MKEAEETTEESKKEGKSTDPSDEPRDGSHIVHPASEFLTATDLRKDFGKYWTPSSEWHNLKCDRCGHSANYETDVICRQCGRAPHHVNKFFWSSSALFVLLCQAASTYHVEVLNRSLSEVLFVWFSFWAAKFISILTFKKVLPVKFGRAIKWISGVAIVVYFFLSENGVADFFSVGPIVAISFLIFIGGILVASDKFGKIHGFAIWIPLGIVLPIDLLALYSFIKIPFIANQIGELTIRMGHFSIVTIPFDDLIKSSHYSFELRVAILLMYVITTGLVLGVMEAIKAESHEKGVFGFWINKMQIAAKNCWTMQRPVWETWYIVNKYAVIRAVLPLASWLLVLYVIYLLIMDATASLVFVLMSPLLIGFLVTVYVHTVTGYQLSEYWKITFHTMGKGLVNLFTWLLLWLLIGALAINGLTLSNTMIFVAIYLIIAGGGIIQRRLRTNQA